MKLIFKSLALLNKAILPSLSKKRVDLSKANKWQTALLGWRSFITKRALD
ncbi:SsrA-binding protein [bacterium]|nr:SsrA-binding protein [bacterium]